MKDTHASGSRAAIDSASQLPPLVMRFGAFGDMVLLTMLLRHLHTRFGKPPDVISSGPWTKPLLEGQPSVGRLYLVRSRRTPYWMSHDQRQLVAQLRERGAGPTWFCDMRLGKELLYRAGIPEEFICDSRSFKWRPDEGYADRYMRLGNESPAAFVGRLPPPIPSPPARAAEIRLTAAARSVADEWLADRHLLGRPYIFVHPGSRHIARRWLRARSGAEKYWPEDRWAQVIRAVRNYRPAHAILLSGTRGERALNDDIRNRAGLDDVHNVAAETPIGVLLPLLERAHSIISVDTGPAHAAAALGCPTVALFGPANPVLFRPGGATTPAVAVTGTVEGRQIMLGVTVEQVINAWLGLIGLAEKLSADSVKCVS
jgi:ADP-heptose:LPS heptosyltransferase